MNNDVYSAYFMLEMKLKQKTTETTVIQYTPYKGTSPNNSM